MVSHFNMFVKASRKHFLFCTGNYILTPGAVVQLKHVMVRWGINYELSAGITFVISLRHLSGVPEIRGAGGHPRLFRGRGVH